MPPDDNGPQTPHVPVVPVLQMSGLADRLRLAIQSIDMHDDNEDAILEAAAILDALDDLLVTASRGPISDPDYGWLLDSAARILHPEDYL